MLWVKPKLTFTFPPAQLNVISNITKHCHIIPANYKSILLCVDSAVSTSVLSERCLWRSQCFFFSVWSDVMFFTRFQGEITHSGFFAVFFLWIFSMLMNSSPLKCACVRARVQCKLLFVSKPRHRCGLHNTSEVSKMNSPVDTKLTVKHTLIFLDNRKPQIRTKI